jgi:hypothetical protein
MRGSGSCRNSAAASRRTSEAFAGSASAPTLTTGTSVRCSRCSITSKVRSRSHRRSTRSGLRGPARSGTRPWRVRASVVDVHCWPGPQGVPARRWLTHREAQFRGPKSVADHRSSDVGMPESARSLQAPRPMRARATSQSNVTYRTHDVPGSSRYAVVPHPPTPRDER